MDTPKVFISYSWHPRENQIASKRYFEKAKVLFGVKTIEEYKEKISTLVDPNFSYDGHHMIPSILKALSSDTVATIG